MSKQKLFETILDFGFKLSLAPINYLINFGFIGKILCFIALFIYSMPILIVFNVIGFTFWILKR